MQKRVFEKRRDVFQAIADPIRREIIGHLAHQSLTVNEVVEKVSVDISRPGISKHLRILKECGIVQFHKKGRERYCEIQAKTLLPVAEWVEQYRSLWEDKLDSFESYLHHLQSKQQNDEQS